MSCNALENNEISDPTAGLTRRIRKLIEAAALDCACQQRVNDALLRFAAHERGRHDRRCLMAARQQRTTIAALLELLGELDDISWQEGDRSAFGELALVFDDIGRMAAEGSAAMRLISRDAGGF